MVKNLRVDFLVCGRLETQIICAKCWNFKQYVTFNQILALSTKRGFVP